MATWHLRHRPRWMVQWCWDGWLSLGIHVDWRTRTNATNRRRYGPYVDLHIGCAILSLGRWPVYSGNIHQSVSVARGGIVAGVDG